MYFDREKIRLWVALAWVMAVGFMWYGFNVVLNDPNKIMLAALDRLESSVIQEDWEQAGAEITLLNNTFMANEFLIRVSNSPEDLSTFRRELNEAAVLVKYQEDDVITQIGGLREEVRTITTVFSGI